MAAFGRRTMLGRVWQKPLLTFPVAVLGGRDGERRYELRCSDNATMPDRDSPLISRLSRRAVADTPGRQRDGILSSIGVAHPSGQSSWSPGLKTMVASCCRSLMLLWWGQFRQCCNDAIVRCSALNISGLDSRCASAGRGSITSVDRSSTPRSRWSGNVDGGHSP